MSIKILQRPLHYVERLESRGNDEISLVVIHCTELPDMTMARTWGEKELHPDSSSGNSGHFYIDRDGSIEQWVPVSRVAHHVRGFNPQSIGIELINNGRYPDWFLSGNQRMSEPYPDLQIEALTALLNHLQEELPVLEMVTGHEDLDIAMIPSEDQPDILIRRKLDPGPQFPWSEVMKQTSLHRLKAKDL
ncbi:MAG: N-acetylmuramoyl-L-alanine amidase [Xanthomonadales bacterium]|nr:N-acetylmuramoyl-L-alanine amidase [Xanthomonadales bacterium]MDH4018066.1 N-acetylmuramoyl-L-alanine amidase [Xanthomonadales bacterium]